MQVRATGITPAELTWDETYQNADGTPRIPSTLGHEISGMVERMADDVPDFRIGNEVYGLVDFPRDGAAAEFAAVRAINLALMLNAPLPNLVLPLPIDNRFKRALPEREGVLGAVLDTVTAGYAGRVHAGWGAGGGPARRARTRRACARWRRSWAAA